MNLSKSDYILGNFCSKALWLKKNKSELLPDYDNAQAVTEFYFKNLKNANIDYGRLARVLTQQKNGAYSNSGIEEIYKSCCTMKISSTDDIINAINSTQPNITRSELASYENDKNRFLGNA